VPELSNAAHGHARQEARRRAGRGCGWSERRGWGLRGGAGWAPPEQRLGLADLACHATQRILNPRVLNSTASCDVANSTCQALSPGGSRRARPAHPPSYAPDDAAPSELLGPTLEALAQDPPNGDAAPSELLGGGGAGGGGGTAGAGGATDGGGAVALAAPPDADAASELLVPMLEEWPDLLGLVLAQLDPTDYALLSRVGKPWLAAVVSRGLPLAEKGCAVPLKLVDFVASVEMLAWAKANGCPWERRTCKRIARGGHLAVLMWAREHGCAWGERVRTPQRVVTWQGGAG